MEEKGEKEIRIKNISNLNTFNIHMNSRNKFSNSYAEGNPRTPESYVNELKIR